jgi:hypothetical protein
MDVVSCPVTNMAFVAIKMGRRQGARSGAYLNRYVTDPAAAGQEIKIKDYLNRPPEALAVFILVLDE